MRSATNTLREKKKKHIKPPTKVSQIKYEPINFDLYSKKQTKLIQINRIQYLIKEEYKKLDLSFCKEKDEQQKHLFPIVPIYSFFAMIGSI